MKFKSDIEVQAGLRDGSDDIGTAGQLLSSTGTITNWIDQADVVSAGATRVLIACKNTSGGTITKGTPVYQTGNVGATDVIEVAEADALISTGYLPAIGLLETDLINNAFGHVVITGELLNITTSPIDGVTPVTGDTIYLKSGGGLTLTKPTGEGNAIQNLGLVGKVSGGNSGSLTVSSIMRQNDVPNLPEGRIWIGDGNTIVSDTVYVDEPNNRVGIGTTTPSTDLEVSSSGVNGIDISQSASNASQSGRLFFTTNTASEGFALFNANGTFQVNSGGIPNDTSGTNRISIIGSSGNVGIGTTSPSTKLHVSGGDIRIDDTERIEFGAGGVRINNDAAGRMYLNAPLAYYWQAGSGYKMVLLNSGNVGIGTTSPTVELQVGNFGGAETPEIIVAGGTSSQIQLNTSNSSGAFAQVGFGGTQFASSNTAGKIKYTHTSQTSPWLDVMSFRVSYSDRMVINGLGNVGIGTTSPGSKLQVNGEIDANGGDGYRINGKPWAAESSNNLRLGDWDGEGFSTSIYDENTVEIVKIKDYGTMINCSSLISSYGANASLAVGTIAPSSAGAAVITLSNNDTTATAGDKTGTIQFAIRADAGTTLGYTSAAIEGSIFANAGFGNAGGGILDFKTSNNGAGSSPQTRMRINQLGNVGIGTTSPSAKLDVVQSTAANGLPALHLIGPNTNSGLTSSVLIIEQGDGKKITIDGNDIDVSSGDLFINDYSKEDVTFGGQIKVAGGVQLANDAASPSASKAGTFRYRTSGNNSYVDMCMQTGASTYAWVNIVTNSW